MIQSTQKIIKVGSSAAVIIPAKDLKREGLKIGDELVIKAEAAVDNNKVELVALTQRLIKRHEQALKNLSQR